MTKPTRSEYLSLVAIVLAVASLFAHVRGADVAPGHRLAATSSPFSNDQGTNSGSYRIGGPGGAAITDSAGTLTGPFASQLGNIAGGDVTCTSGGNCTVEAVSGSTPIVITPSTLQWANGTASPTITQVTPTTDVATADFNITPQAPFAGATVHLIGGNANINLATPASGSAESAFQIKRGGLIGISMGRYPQSSPTFWQINFGANARAPTATNFAFLGDDAGAFTELNAATGIKLRIGAAATDPLGLYSGAAQFFGASGTSSVGGGVNVIGITNAGVVPSSNPSGGGVLYAIGGGGAWRGSGGSTTQFVAVGAGTVNTQKGLIDISYMGFVRTVSSASPAAFAAYTTLSNTGGLVECRLTSKAATTGTGIAVGNLATSEYLFAYQNVSGTVTLDSGSPPALVTGSNRTTAAALTAPVLTVAASGATWVPSVTNVALATIDSQITCRNDVN